MNIRLFQVSLLYLSERQEMMMCGGPKCVDSPSDYKRLVFKENQ